MVARDLIIQADEIAREQGLTQSAWCKVAGKAESGQTVSRILSRGECKVNTLLDLLDPLGYELCIVRKEESA